MGSLSPTAVFMLAGSKQSVFLCSILNASRNRERDYCPEGDAALHISHLWLLTGIFSKNGNIRSAILQELQLGDLSTSTAKDNILWRRSIALG